MAQSSWKKNHAIDSHKNRPELTFFPCAELPFFMDEENIAAVSCRRRRCEEADAFFAFHRLGKNRSGLKSRYVKKTEVLEILPFLKPTYLLDPNTLKYSILYYF
jgi:hypothetical protein